MKHPTFIFICCLSSLNSQAQIKYSTEVKTFIDYDTAVIVFQHALLIDGNGDEPKSSQTIVIKNGKIEWVGDDTKAPKPTEALVIDLSGKTLMP